jgi:hypothetical protein
MGATLPLIFALALFFLFAVLLRQTMWYKTAVAVGVVAFWEQQPCRGLSGTGSIMC